MTRPKAVQAAPERLLRTTRRVLAGLIAVYVVLIATHGGEFWPFSVYPMFAGAGRPWQRALVRVIGDAPDSARRSYPLGDVPGAPLPLGAYGIPQDDLSAMVQRAERWGEADTTTLATMFGALPCRAPLLVLRVRGSLESGALGQVATPVARLGCQGGQVQVERLLAAGPS